MINQNAAENELTAEMLEEYNYYVGQKQALDRLETNPDFKKVILEGYFRDKAVNGVSLLATDYVRKNGLRAEIMENLVAISNLQDYFLTIKRMGTEPEDDDIEDESTEG
jgi:hypothetical protein